MKTFTSTSTKPYDRHLYKLHLKDGRSYLYDNYEDTKAAWFYLSRSLEANLLDRVDVLSKSRGNGFG